MDISTDLGCDRNMVTDIDLGRNPVTDVTMVPS